MQKQFFNQAIECRLTYAQITIFSLNTTQFPNTYIFPIYKFYFMLDKKYP